MRSNQVQKISYGNITIDGTGAHGVITVGNITIADTGTITVSDGVNDRVIIGFQSGGF